MLERCLRPVSINRDFVFDMERGAEGEGKLNNSSILG